MTCPHQGCERASEREGGPVGAARAHLRPPAVAAAAHGPRLVRQREWSHLSRRRARVWKPRVDSGAARRAAPRSERAPTARRTRTLTAGAQREHFRVRGQFASARIFPHEPGPRPMTAAERSTTRVGRQRTPHHTMTRRRSRNKQAATDWESGHFVLDRSATIL